MPSVMGLCSSSPPERYLIAKILLLSVVSAKAATPCHQIQSRQVNLRRVICRSFHSITPDLTKPSSQRRDLCRCRFDSLRTCSTSYAAVAVLLQRKSVASIHMRWSTTPNLRARATLARFMPRRFATSRAQHFRLEKRVVRVSMM